MPIERVPDTSLTYYLIAFDKKGRERGDDPDGGTLSRRALSDIAAQPPTDVFLISHGWKGDVPAAREQCNNWIRAMTMCPADLARMRAARPEFRPLLIGLHWPSLPFGDEDYGAGSAAFDMRAVPRIEELIERYAERIADTPAARAALHEIFQSALDDDEPAQLPEKVADAYRTLNREAGLTNGGEGAAPGADRESFDPETAYQNARASAGEDPVSFGQFRLSGLLAPLQQFSFWKIKERARVFGESGGYDLLGGIQNSAPKARVHLMGHSFGCIVVSAATAGPGARGSLPRPVDTLFLVQGALSFWSYSSKIAEAGGIPGYFHPILAGRMVAGAMLATTSEHDTAVGRFYPLGAGVKHQVAFVPGQLPKYGGLGAYGMQGPGTNAVSKNMLPIGASYGFHAGGAYNIEASDYIRNGGGASGAHSDITHPEVAHAFWEAVLAMG